MNLGLSEKNQMNTRTLKVTIEHFNWTLHLLTVWRFQAKKNQKHHSWHEEQNKGTTKPLSQQLSMDLVTREKWTEEKLKKAVRLKLLELCKLELKSQLLACSTFL